MRRRSATARLLGLQVGIPSGAWMCECCVLSGTGLVTGRSLVQRGPTQACGCGIECDQDNIKLR